MTKTLPKIEPFSYLGEAPKQRFIYGRHAGGQDGFFALSASSGLNTESVSISLLASSGFGEHPSDAERLSPEREAEFFAVLRLIEAATDMLDLLKKLSIAWLDCASETEMQGLIDQACKVICRVEDADHD